VGMPGIFQPATILAHADSIATARLEPEDVQAMTRNTYAYHSTPVPDYV